MENVEKQALKIKFECTPDFQTAWDAFMALGYQWGGDASVKPRTAQFLYSYLEGWILADYFDVEGADLLSPNSALGYFNSNPHKEVTLAELKIMAYGVDAAVFIGIDPEYIYYSVDADGQAYYTKTEPHISEKGDYWGKDISMRDAHDFKLHTDWKQSLIKRNSSKEVLADPEVATQ